MQRSTKQMLGFWALSALVLIGSFYLGTHKNMTGLPYSEIEAYMAAHPEKTVTYSLTVKGAAADIRLSHRSREVTLTDDVQLDSLTAQAPYLQKLEAIRLEGFRPEVLDLDRLNDAFPQTRIDCASVLVLGEDCPTDVLQLDLSAMTPEDLPEAQAALRALPALERVNLNGPEGHSTVPLEVASALQSARPELPLDYTTELFGQAVSTQMEQLDYFRADIGDAGLEQFRLLLPMMHNLRQLTLDWCGTSNEATAQLRDDFPEIKVVWRIFMGQFNCLTDTYKVWATWSVTNEQAQALKYCTEVKYLDLGHNHIRDIGFVANMPDLEVAILAIGDEESCEALRHCPKLEYLEIFSTKITDISPLADCKELKHLNISNLKIDDITALYGLDKLERMFCTLNGRIPQEQKDKFRELHPDCYTIFMYGGDPSDFKWRFYDGFPGGTMKVPRYALLTVQFGYDIWDFSQYPKGHVRYEINSVEDAMEHRRQEKEA